MKAMAFSDLLKRNQMTLIVSLPANSPELADAALEAGADALKVHINVDHRASGTHFGSLAEERRGLEGIRHLARCPVGIVVGGSSRVPVTEVEGCREMGFDFISFYAHHFPASFLRFPGLEKMVAPDHTYSLEMIRALGAVGFDILEASVMRPEGYGEPLNVADLALYRAIREAVSLPIVIPTQRFIHPEEVSLLHEVGVEAIMIGAVVTGREASAIAEATGRFRQAIDRLR